MHNPHRMRVLVVSNMAPDAEHPERGGFVRDHVAALRRLPDLDVTLEELTPGAYRAAARTLHRRYRSRTFDVAHAHFGLSAVPALVVRARRRGVTLHGTDVHVPRSRLVSLAVLPTQSLVAASTTELRDALPGWARRRAQVLPVGVALDRFRAIPRPEARAALGLDPAERFLLFPWDPTRADKRVDRARELAARAGLPLRTLGGVDPTRMPEWINAATAVVAPTMHEGFGLAAVEALACDVPVLATPTGIHPATVGRTPGCLCAPWDPDGWLAALRPHLDAPDPRVDGRRAVLPLGTDACARALRDAWRTLLPSPLDSQRGPAG